MGRINSYVELVRWYILIILIKIYTTFNFTVENYER
jgi:hypothetical protein